MREFIAIEASEPPAEGDRAARLTALVRLIDWAEREALAMGAPECGLCLQLARVAVQTRQRDGT